MDTNGDLIPDACESCGEDDVCNILCPNDPDCDDHTCDLTDGCILDPAGEYTNLNQCSEVCESCPVSEQYDSTGNGALDVCCEEGSIVLDLE